MTDLAQSCIKYRAEHGLSQEALAKLCGVTRETVNKVENGKSVLKTTEAKIRMKIIEKGCNNYGNHLKK